MPLPLPVIVLIALLVIAVGVAVNAFVRDLERRAILERAGTSGDTSILLKSETEGFGHKVAKWIFARAPESWRSPKASADKLLHAGFDSDAAPVVFIAARIASAILVPLIVLMVMPRGNALLFTAAIAIGVVIGLILPQAFVNFRASTRQEHMRRAIPGLARSAGGVRGSRCQSGRRDHARRERDDDSAPRLRQRAPDRSPARECGDTARAGAARPVGAYGRGGSARSRGQHDPVREVGNLDRHRAARVCGIASAQTQTAGRKTGGYGAAENDLSVGGFHISRPFSSSCSGRQS